MVTGGAGFVGSHLCEALLRTGVDVVCLDNMVTGAERNLTDFADHPRLTVQTVDVTDDLRVDGPVDLVLHLASPASPYDYLRLPVETMTANSIGTLHALELAETKQARFVLTSTSEAYGDPQVHPQPETYWGNVNPVGPRAVYDEAKRFAEALTTAFRSARGVDTAIVRLFNSYGPRMRSHDGRAVPTFIRQALDGAPLTVAGDGSQTRSVCFVADTVRGILAVAGADLSGPVNVGSRQEMTVLDIARDVIGATGSSSSIEFVPLPIDDPKVRCPDTQLIERSTGWHPTVSWPDGLSATVASFDERRPQSALAVSGAEQADHR